MTHRDDLPRFSARSVRCGDASHRKACATPSESLGKSPFRSPMRPVGGRLWVIINVIINAPWYYYCHGDDRVAGCD